MTNGMNTDVIFRGEQCNKMAEKNYNYTFYSSCKSRQIGINITHPIRLNKQNLCDMKQTSTSGTRKYENIEYARKTYLLMHDIYILYLVDIYSFNMYK